MAKKKPKDPSEAIRKKAGEYTDVEIGESCTQTSFKIGKKAFLYIGMQGGRHKAMFKLDESLPEAELMAKNEPDNFQVGSTSWVTTRFDDKKPLPVKIWKRWLEESYQLSVGKNAKRS